MKPKARAGDELTERELEVWQFIACGYQNLEIADELGIGVRTVETHRATLMIKLDTRGAVPLALLAIKRGEVTL